MYTAKMKAKIVRIYKFSRQRYFPGCWVCNSFEITRTVPLKVVRGRRSLRGVGREGGRGRVMVKSIYGCILNISRKKQYTNNT